MPHKKLSLLLAMSFLVSTSTGSQARRAYSSYDYEHTKDTEIEYEPDSVQTKNVGYISDWAFLKTAEADATLKDTLLKQSESGDAGAMYKLASMYFHGKGVERDLVESLKWNRQAAFKGNALAQNNLGYMFDEGKGTKKDPIEALKWYKTAANFGCPGAQVNLGYFVEHGKGLPNEAKDFKQAGEWYQKAAEQGNLVAKRNLYLYSQQGIRLADAVANADGTAAQPIAGRAFAPGAADTTNVTGANAAPTKPAQIASAASAASTSTTAATNSQAQTAAPVQAPVVATQKSNTTAAATVPTVAPSTAVSQSVTSTENTATDADPLKAGSDKLTALLKKMSAQVPGAATPITETSSTEKSTETSEKKEKIASAPEKTADVVKTEKPSVATETKVPTTRKVDAPSIKEVKKAEMASTPAPASTVSAKTAEAPAKEPALKAATAAESVTIPVKETTKEASTDAAKAPYKEASALIPTASAAVAQKSAATAIASVPIAPVIATTVKATPVVTTPVATVPVTSTPPAAVPAAAPATSSPKISAVPTVSTPPPPTATTQTSSTTAASATAATTNATAGKDKASVRPVRDKWALVVGISQFDSPGIPKLDYSSKDATDFYNYLVNESNFAPDHVRLLLDDKATFRRVMSELGSKFLARVVKPDDLVLLYFSTHGSPSQMDIRGKNYLVAYDSDPNDLFATGIEMQKILESIQNRVLTDRVVLVMDACHSGFTEANSKGMGRVGNFNADELAQGSGQLVICSSEPSEQAWESTRYKNGVFTRKLLEGLRSKGPNTTLIEAYNATKRGVADEVREDRAGVRQTPVLKGKWNGNDLIVAVPPSFPQMVPLAVKKELEPDSAAIAHSKTKITDARKESKEAREAKEPPKQAIATLSSSSKELSKTKDQDSAIVGASSDLVLVLTGKSFYPDSDPKGLVRECFAALKSGNSRNPSDLYYMRAQAYIQLGEWNNAINDLSDAIHGAPNKAQYYLARGYVHHKLGQELRAREDIEEARFVDTHLPLKVTFSD